MSSNMFWNVADPDGLAVPRDKGVYLRVFESHGRSEWSFGENSMVCLGPCNRYGGLAVGSLAHSRTDANDHRRKSVGLRDAGPRNH